MLMMIASAAPLMEHHGCNASADRPRQVRPRRSARRYFAIGKRPPRRPDCRDRQPRDPLAVGFPASHDRGRACQHPRLPEGQATASRTPTLIGGRRRCSSANDGSGMTTPAASSAMANPADMAAAHPGDDGGLRSSAYRSRGRANRLRRASGDVLGPIISLYNRRQPDRPWLPALSSGKPFGPIAWASSPTLCLRQRSTRRCWSRSTTPRRSGPIQRPGQRNGKGLNENHAREG